MGFSSAPANCCCTKPGSAWHCWLPVLRVVRLFIGTFPAEAGVLLLIKPKHRAILPVFILLVAASQAGPIDFGLSEYKAALAARNLKWKIAYEVTPDPPDSYRIEPYKFGGAHVTGGDLRGLMYGLLEAA